MRACGFHGLIVSGIYTSFILASCQVRKAKILFMSYGLLSSRGSCFCRTVQHGSRYNIESYSSDHMRSYRLQVYLICRSSNSYMLSFCVVFFGPTTDILALNGSRSKQQVNSVGHRVHDTIRSNKVRFFGFLPMRSSRMAHRIWTRPLYSTILENITRAHGFTRFNNTFVVGVEFFSSGHNSLRLVCRAFSPVYLVSSTFCGSMAQPV